MREFCRKTDIDKILWMAEITNIDKQKIANKFHTPLKLSKLNQYEDEFSKMFEKEMKQFL